MKINCPNCGRENLEDAKFCSECGTKFEEILKCLDCGTELDTDDSFCYACGKPIEDFSEPEIRGTLAKQESFQEAVKKAKNNTSSKPHEIRGTLAKQESFQEAIKPYTPPENPTKLHTILSALLHISSILLGVLLVAFFVNITVNFGLLSLHYMGIITTLPGINSGVVLVTSILFIIYGLKNYGNDSERRAEWIIKVAAKLLKLGNRTLPNTLGLPTLVILILGAFSMLAIGRIINVILLFLLHSLPSTYWWIPSDMIAPGVSVKDDFEALLGMWIISGSFAIVTGVYPFNTLRKLIRNQGDLTGVVKHKIWESLSIAIILGSFSTSMILDSCMALYYFLFVDANEWFLEVMMLPLLAIILVIYPTRLFFKLAHGINIKATCSAAVTSVIILVLFMNIMYLQMEDAVIAPLTSLACAIPSGFLVYQLVSRRTAPK